VAYAKPAIDFHIDYRTRRDYCHFPPDSIPVWPHPPPSEHQPGYL